MIKNIIATVAILLGLTSFAEVEEYQFKSNIKIPVLQGSAKKGYYRSYVNSTANGTMIYDSEAQEGYLVVTVQKLKTTYTLSLTNDTFAVLFGKKQDGAALRFGACDSDNTISIDCSGIGSTKVRSSGCAMCGGEVCTRVYRISGNLVGTIDLSCENPQFAEITDTCDVDYSLVTNTAPIYGTWSILLKTVDSEKFR